MLDKSIEEKFMSEIHRRMWTFVNEPEEVIKAIKEAPAWNENAIKFAAIK